VSCLFHLSLCPVTLVFCSLPLSPCSNPQQVRTRSVHLVLDVDFRKTTLSGTVEFTAEVCWRDTLRVLMCTFACVSTCVHVYTITRTFTCMHSHMHTRPRTHSWQTAHLFLHGAHGRAEHLNLPHACKIHAH